jgi:nicotinate-nucleotide adenylyltransferase
MNADSGRLGIFGGTFNPVHLGHLRLAEDVREEYALDRVVFIPVNIPPHKEIRDAIDPAHRLRMVQLSIMGNAHFLCDDVELRRGGISYTVDTIDHVYTTYAFEGMPAFIIGSDLLGELGTWKDVGRLLDRARFIVLMRDGTGRIDPLLLPERFAFFGKRKIDVTSSEIRGRLARGESIRYLVPDKVFQYIVDNDLYR